MWMTFLWTNVTQVLLLGDTSRHGHVPLVASGRLEARGRQELGAVGLCGMQLLCCLGLQGNLSEFCSRSDTGKGRPQENNQRLLRNAADACAGWFSMTLWLPGDSSCSCTLKDARNTQSCRSCPCLLCAAAWGSPSPALKGLSQSLRVKSLFFFRCWRFLHVLKSTRQLINSELDPGAIYHLCFDQGRNSLCRRWKGRWLQGFWKCWQEGASEQFLM